MESQTLLFRSFMGSNMKFTESIPALPVYSNKPSTLANLRHRALVAFILLGTSLWLYRTSLHYLPLPESFQPQSTQEYCVQANPVAPYKNAPLWRDIGSVIDTQSFENRAVGWLGGAVQIPTESYDGMGPPTEDSRFQAFIPFQQYLVNVFPLTHASLALTKVNLHGLLYEWQGSNPDLKPVVLMGHQDVVPVDPTTVESWEHPPYSGHFDGERIWGRGSSDDKSGVIAILSTVEILLEKKFQPTRTIILSFGFDEEISGVYGAKHLAKAILEKYGKHGIAFVLDEGGGFSDQYDAVVAQPAIAEKGYLDTRVEVTAPGGHSSVPPEHTSIGILASLLVQFEASPYVPTLSRKSPFYTTLQCLAANAPSLPSDLKKAIKKSVHSDKGLRELEKIVVKNKLYRSIIGTTQAVDVIQGGVKSNALPEQVWAIVNHRISTDSSVEEVQKKDTGLLKSLASKYNLTYVAFGKAISETDGPSSGTLTISDAFGDALQPAPVTPTDKDAAAYKLLSGSIKSTYIAQRSLPIDDDTLVVHPGISTGNTDTQYYWDLSPNIFRYNHHSGSTPSNVHTVNESIEIKAFLEMIRFFSTLILNSDESIAI